MLILLSIKIFIPWEFTQRWNEKFYEFKARRELRENAEKFMVCAVRSTILALSYMHKI